MRNKINLAFVGNIALTLTTMLSAGCWPENMVFVSNEEELLRAKGMDVPARDMTHERIWLLRYRVISSMYPLHRVTNTIEPPEVGGVECGAVMDRCMVLIKPEDEWRVTHRIGNEYLIQSKSFSKRLCRHISGSSYMAHESTLGCFLQMDFAVAISLNGVITRGWELLQNQTQTGNRLFHHDLGPIDTSGWPAGVVFVPYTK